MKKSKKLGTGLATNIALFAGNVALAATNIGSSIDKGAQPITGLQDTVTTVVGGIKWIAIVVAVVMVIYVGIKYLTAGAGTKADVKSNLLPMLVGAILVASAGVIVDAVFQMASQTGE